MRILLQTLAIFTLFSLLACSSKSSLDNSFKLYSDAIDVKAISSPGKEANLIFFRSPQDRQNYADVVANVFVNDRYLSTLLTEGYSEARVCPGDNNLFVTAREGNELSPDYSPKTIRLEAGKTYFVELNKGLNDQYKWQIRDAQDPVLNIEGLRRQVHTISRYSEDCAVKLAKEAAREQENQAKIAADKLAAEQSSIPVMPILPTPVINAPVDVIPASASNSASREVVIATLASARILFPFAQFEWASVNAEGRHSLQSFAMDYKRLKLSKKIRLSGHADPMGDEAANILLSQKRLKTIRAALLAQGIHTTFEEKAMGSRGVLVDCTNDTYSDDIGDAVTRAQKSAGSYWVQVYAGMSVANSVVNAEQKKLAETLKTSVVLKKTNDGLVRIWLGQFNDFSAAESAVKASKVKGAFVRFVSKNPESSAQSCNQPNRRVDIEIVE
jgi:outer membrane protein OmpA-like peptidoglycan-associated protein